MFELIPYLFLLVLAQQFLGLAVFLVACRPRNNVVADGDLPEALVVLATRGADPTLKQCVRGLAQQDYPHYTARIVVDGVDDSAWDIVQDVLATIDSDHVVVSPLVAPASTCSLKCSAVHQATESLPPSCEVVATLDSDIVPHATWLRELVAPLKDPRVGATAGNRWYAPPVGNWGSWIRYLWNSVALVVMYYNRVPWGGSLAARASILRETDLRTKWLHAGCEDLLLTAALRRKKLRFRFVPSLLMVNRDECDIPSCLRFVNRQLVWTRLYHPATWWISSLSYVVITGLLVLAAVAGVFAGISQQWSTAMLLLGSIPVYFAAQAIQLVLLEGLLVRRHLALRGEPGTRLQLRSFLAIFVCQFYSLRFAARSFSCRLIKWRGIEYSVGGPWDIRMVEYAPYEAEIPAVASAEPAL